MRSGDRVHLLHDARTGVEAIHASFAGYAYDRHCHDAWLVGVTESGVQDFFCRGARRRSTTGRVILMEPQEPHDGEAGSAGGFAYRMLYLPPEWLRRNLARDRDAALGFRATLCDDAALAAAIHHACAILAEPADPLGCDAAMDTLLQRLRPHLGCPPSRMPRGRDARLARRARECLHASLAEPIGADALAAATGAADRFQLARAFRAAYGTSPHAWLVQYRLQQARRLLALGHRPAEVAAACGFADQSHLGRWFRRAYAVTPAAYRACCTDVPDADAPLG